MDNKEDIYPNIDTIIFTMSRMNPPTPGHLFLIQNLIEEGIKQNTNKVYVILSKTNDNNEDPISCESKINVLGNLDDINSMTEKLKLQMYNNKIDLDEKQLIQNMNVIYICVKPEQKSPFSPLFDIINSYPEDNKLNLFMIIGDDRKDLLDSVADTFLFKNERIISFDGIVLDRPSMDKYKNMSKEQLETLDINSVPTGAFSASFVRNLVKYNLKDKFDDVYKNYLDTSKINELYEEIKEGLLLGDKKSKSSSKVSTQKYNYPLKKGTKNYDLAIKNKTLKRKRDDMYGGKNTKKNRIKYKTKKNKKHTKKTKPRRK
jgi:hypothetical protein